MKILITGKKSYIGNQIKKWIKNKSDYEISRISLRDDQWKALDFSGYDAVIHLAGIVHKKDREVPLEEYFAVNRDLTKAIAIKAKAEGVTQFIYLSSMAVYGERGNLNQRVVITSETKESPNTPYGQSKFEGEKALRAMESNKFKVAILRPPMIYGKECPGNYARLRKIALRWGVYPNMHNQRSMLYIDNLMMMIKGILDQKLQGTFFPQDEEYSDTLEMIKEIRKAHDKKTWVLNLVRPLMFLAGKKSSTMNKAFGNLCYDKCLSIIKEVEYQKVGMKEGINRIENESVQYKPPGK